MQQPIVTSTGKSGGYWDTGYGALYFGDTGTAATAIAVCHSLSGGNSTRQQQYSAALAKLANFATDGCHQIPTKYDEHHRCPPKATGWIVGSTGAIADGYDSNGLDCATPYTIAAGTMSAAFAELSAIDAGNTRDGRHVSRSHGMPCCLEVTAGTAHRANGRRLCRLSAALARSGSFLC